MFSSERPQRPSKGPPSLIQGAQLRTQQLSPSSSGSFPPKQYKEILLRGPEIDVPILMKRVWLESVV